MLMVPVVIRTRLHPSKLQAINQVPQTQLAIRHSRTHIQLPVHLSLLTKYPSGYTSSNGPNYIGYLTARYNRSQVLTYNLASGGATVDALLAEPYLPTVRSLIDQVVADFMPAYGVLPETERKAQWTSDDSLFIFFIGVNDVLKTYGANNATLVPQIFAEYGAMVDKVYSRGARNFLFLDVPTLQFSPLSLKFPATLNTETAALKDWAGRLSGLVDWLKERHPDVFAATFSTYSVFEKIIQNTKAFAQTQGLREISGFCEQYANGTPKGNTLVNGCKVPADEYFWLNNIHPTYPVHDALAFEIATALEGFPPSNICAPEDTQ